jgi:hypothetical protein
MVYNLLAEQMKRGVRSPYSLLVTLAYPRSSCPSSLAHFARKRCLGAPTSRHFTIISKRLSIFASANST